MADVTGRIHGYPDNQSTSEVPTLNLNEQDEEPFRLLRLNIVSGQKLAKKDIFGASDPYVRIDLVTGNKNVVIDSVYTKTKKRTLDPQWNEEFIFRVKPNSDKIVMEVFDENRLTRDDFLGMVEIPLQAIPTERRGRTLQEKQYILRPRSVRSRVKGFLKIYHELLREDNEEDGDDTTSQVEPEVGWETLGIWNVSTGLTGG